MNRRDYLRRSGLLLAGAAVAACNEQAPGNGGLPEPQSESAVPDRAEMYDRGAPPIETSGWTAPTGVLPGYPVLGQELDADVVVVGAGLAGSSLALHLAEAGVDVVVLEARQPGWGASGRNAGHVLPTLKDIAVIRRFPDGGKAFLESVPRAPHHHLRPGEEASHRLRRSAVGLPACHESQQRLREAESEVRVLETGAGPAGGVARRRGHGSDDGLEIFRLRRPVRLGRAGESLPVHERHDHGRDGTRCPGFRRERGSCAHRIRQPLARGHGAGRRRRRSRGVLHQCLSDRHRSAVHGQFLSAHGLRVVHEAAAESSAGHPHAEPGDAVGGARGSESLRDRRARADHHLEHSERVAARRRRVAFRQAPAPGSTAPGPRPRRWASSSTITGPAGWRCATWSSRACSSSSPACSA